MRLVQGEVLQGGSPFPPIATLAFLSDCEVAALLGPDGNVEWMCLPRFDGPSVFGALLDRAAARRCARRRGPAPPARRPCPTHPPPAPHQRERPAAASPARSSWRRRGT